MLYKWQKVIDNYTRLCITPVNAQYIISEQNCLALQLLYMNNQSVFQIMRDTQKNIFKALTEFIDVKNKYNNLDKRLGYNNFNNSEEKQDYRSEKMWMNKYIFLINKYREYSNRTIPIESLITAVINVRKAEGIDVSNNKLNKNILAMLKYNSISTQKTFSNDLVDNNITLKDNNEERFLIKEARYYYDGISSRKIKKQIHTQRALY